MPYFIKWLTSLTVGGLPTLTAADPLTDAIPVFNCVITKTAGDFAVASLSTVNEGNTLLANDYALIGYVEDADWPKDGSPIDTADIKVLMQGRLLRFPIIEQRGEVALEFVASPLDYEARYIAFHEANKVAPYWNSLFVDPGRQNIPSEGLEGRAQYYDFNRRTLTLGYVRSYAEDGASIDYDYPTYDKDSVDLDVGDVPLKTVNVVLDIEWVQAASGVVDLNGMMRDAFGGEVSSHTPEALVENWPDAQELSGSGWTIIESKCNLLGRSAYDTGQGLLLELGSGSRKTKYYTFVPFLFDTSLKASYAYEQARREQCIVRVSADLQDRITDEDRTEWVRITLRPVDNTDYDLWAEGVVYSEGDIVRYGSNLYEALEDHLSPAQFSSVVADVANYKLEGVPELYRPRWRLIKTTTNNIKQRPRFFDTDEGAAAIDHAVARAHALLADSARMVEYTITCPLAELWDVEIGDVLRFKWEGKLPGDEVTGVVTAYTIDTSGDNGAGTVQVTIGCIPGAGGSQATPAAGTSTYEDGVFEAGVFQAVGGDRVTAAGISYSYTPPALVEPVNVAALDQPQYAMPYVEVVNSGAQQNEDAAKPYNRSYGYIAGGSAGVAVYYLYQLAHHPQNTLMRFTLRQITGHPKLERLFDITTNGWVAPNNIDVETP